MAGVGRQGPQLVAVERICGVLPEAFKTRKHFADLVAIDPNERFNLGGSGEPAMRALNPRLIYVSISGAGDSGPYAEKRIYDPIVQGLSGFADALSALTAASEQTTHPEADERRADALPYLRIALTAARELERCNGRYAVVSLCIGVGQGLAVVIERV